MRPKHWTILIIPPGTGTTRTYVIGPRGRRALAWAAGTAALLVVSAIAVLFTPFATPSARLLRMQNARLESQMAEIDKRLMTLSDTLA